MRLVPVAAGEFEPARFLLGCQHRDRGRSPSSTPSSSQERVGSLSCRDCLRPLSGIDDVRLLVIWRAGANVGGSQARTIPIRGGLTRRCVNGEKVELGHADDIGLGDGGHASR